MDEREDLPATSSGSQRIDKWLWYARVAKSRSLAAKLVTDGAVRINRVKSSKASDSVKPGDVVTVAVHHRVRILEVRLIGARRGPATEAATLYQDLTPPPPPKSDASPADSAALREPGAGRPTKRERRQIDKLRDRS
ncbi:MAG: RNA-binding S4 domain-containing protein [Hyphomicrobiaceae bacterium]